MPVVSARRQSQPMSPGARLAFGILIMLVGAGLVVFGCDQAGHAAGVLGTRGVLKVASCEQVGFGKNSYIRCTGEYHSNNGQLTDPSASLHSNLTLPTGEYVAADRVAAGSYVRMLTSSSAGWAALAMFGLTLIALGGAALASRNAPSGNIEFRNNRLGRWFGRALLLFLAGLTACGAVYLMSTVTGQ